MRQPFNVNSAAQAAAIAALSDHNFIDRCIAANAAGRKRLVEGMQLLGYKAIAGEANFILCEVGDGNRFFEELQERGIIVRPLASYGMPAYVRITIGTEIENESLLDTAREVSKIMRVSS